MAEFVGFLKDESDDSVKDSDDSDDFKEFAPFPAKRETCGRCRRPSPVCLCGYFPPEPVKTESRVIILQHKDEVKRCLATVPLMMECLDREKVCVLRARGKRFNPQNDEYSLLSRALQCNDTVLLYPGQSAVDVRSLPQNPIGKHDDSAVLVLDGTWAQAKSMFARNPFLQSVKQIKLSGEMISEYVIRTQPNNQSLSTLESVAYALAWFERRPDIVDVLVHPLRALCQYQLKHGAAVHVSKDNPGYVSREVLIRQKKERKDRNSVD